MLLQSQAVATILPLPLSARFGLLPSSASFVDVEEDRLRTSAALAAAALGSADSPGTCGFFPSVLPGLCGPLILGGAVALALSGREGAFAGCAPRVLPSPLKLALSLPQQLPMVIVGAQEKAGADCVSTKQQVLDATNTQDLRKTGIRVLAVSRAFMRISVACDVATCGAQPGEAWGVGPGTDR